MREAPGLPFLLTEGMEVSFVPPVLDAPRQGRIVSLQPQQDGRFLVIFDTVQDRDTAEKLAGCFCLVKRDELPFNFDAQEEDSFAGYDVHDDTYGPLGKVEDVLDNTAQSLLNIKGQYGEIMVPFVNEIVYKIDHGSRLLLTRIPEGLVGLNTENASLRLEENEL